MKIFNYLAQTKGWLKRQQLYQGRLIVRPWPANLREYDRAFFAKNREYQLLPNWIVRLREVSLLENGMAFHGLHLHSESLVVHDWRAYNWRGLLRLFLKLPRLRLPASQQYILVHDSWSETYYHWMADALPRLLAVRDQLAGAVLLLPESYQADYHRQTLNAFGVVTIERLKPDVRYVVPKLLMPVRLAHVASYNPQAMLELRAILLAKFPPLPQADLGERIYISRAGASRRRVINEAEVATYIREQEFAVVQLENYSFAEQVSIMARARVMVSIHGAGLTNMLFMPVGSKVLELQMQDDGTNRYYYTLSADLGISYYYQFCAPNDASLTVQDADLLVDMAEFKRTVSQVLTD